MKKVTFSKLALFGLSIFTMMVLVFGACKKQENLIQTQQSEEFVAVSSAAAAKNPCSCTTYLSPEGYCTAGVRLDKGGCKYNGSIYCGVLFSGNAKDWYANASAKGYSVGSTPSVGAIVVWPSNSASSVGHVGIVTGQVNGKWQYKAMNDYPNGFNAWSTRNIADYPNSKNRVSPTGYIYSWK